MKHSGHALDEMMTDQQIDNVLEYFHESLLNDNSIWCGFGSGTCSYDKRLENLRESLEGIESEDLLLRMYRRLKKITNKLGKEEIRPLPSDQRLDCLNWNRNVFG